MQFVIITAVCQSTQYDAHRVLAVICDPPDVFDKISPGLDRAAADFWRLRWLETYCTDDLRRWQFMRDYRAGGRT